MALGVGYQDDCAEIIDVAQGSRLAFLKGHKGAVAGVMLLPDGKTAATASYDQAVKLWDLPTQATTTLYGEWLACFALTLSPDGRRVASGGAETTIRLWDPSTEQLVAVLPGRPDDDIIQLAFSPDGNTLVALTSTTVRLWRAPTFAEIHRAEHAAPPP
jgi:WD40 repeat protein